MPAHNETSLRLLGQHSPCHYPQISGLRIHLHRVSQTPTQMGPLTVPYQTLFSDPMTPPK